jgi:RNA polymerase sigma-70 factor (ECF subfamily)
MLPLASFLTFMSAASDHDTRDLIRDGGESKLAELFNQHRESLERIIYFRLNPALRSRIDSSDVLQETYLTVSKRHREFLNETNVSFFVWVRQLTLQTLIDLQRTHFREKRDAGREIHLPDHSPSVASSLSIAQFLLDDRTSPSQAAVKAEEIEQLRSALDCMNETDREILAMRHFEHLSNQQVAEALGLTPTAASNRYVRAASKLGEILSSLSMRPSP